MGDFVGGQHADAVAKPTSKDIIRKAGIYELIGINIEKCDMPHIDPTGNMGRPATVANDLTAGYQIKFKLEPALDDLVRSLILQKKAPFLDAEVEGSKALVKNELARMIGTYNHYFDKEGITGLGERLSVPITELNDKLEEVAGEIVQALSDEIGRLDIASQRGSR